MIDAHQHYWQLGPTPGFNFQWLDSPALAAIKRDYLPADLQPQQESVGIKHSIFVQTQHDYRENDWALKLADENPFMVGVVGWVDLASPDCEEQLLKYKKHPKFVGVRHVTQDEPDDDFIIRPDVIRGLEILQKHSVPFDLLFYVKHLKHATTLAEKLPDLPMVIDHLAKPKIKDQSIDDWLPQFRAAAKYKNVYCKLSGMITEADWQNWRPEHLRVYVQHALELFGPERLMFGSDWPVCELAGNYQHVFEATRQAIGSVSESEYDAIFGGTARKFYSISDSMLGQ